MPTDPRSPHWYSEDDLKALNEREVKAMTAARARQEENVARRAHGFPFIPGTEPTPPSPPPPRGSAAHSIRRENAARLTYGFPLIPGTSYAAPTIAERGRHRIAPRPPSPGTRPPGTRPPGTRHIREPEFPPLEDTSPESYDYNALNRDDPGSLARKRVDRIVKTGPGAYSNLPGAQGDVQYRGALGYRVDVDPNAESVQKAQAALKPGENLRAYYDALNATSRDIASPEAEEDAAQQMSTAKALEAAAEASAARQRAVEDMALTEKYPLSDEERQVHSTQAGLNEALANRALAEGKKIERESSGTPRIVRSMDEDRRRLAQSFGEQTPQGFADPIEAADVMAFISALPADGTLTPGEARALLSDPGAKRALASITNTIYGGGRQPYGLENDWTIAAPGDRRSYPVVDELRLPRDFQNLRTEGPSGTLDEFLNFLVAWRDPQQYYVTYDDGQGHKRSAAFGDRDEENMPAYTNDRTTMDRLLKALASLTAQYPKR